MMRSSITRYSLLKGGAQVIGPILMGPVEPVHVFLRDATVAHVVHIAAVEAQELSHSKNAAVINAERRDSGAVAGLGGKIVRESGRSAAR